MFGSVILDVAVGLVLTYLLLSLVTSAIREGIAGIFKTRAKLMERGIEQLLQDPALVKDFYEHSLIFSLYRGTSYEAAKAANTLPSYIPATSFAKAMIDLVARGPTSAATSVRFQTRACSVPSSPRSTTRRAIWTKPSRISNTGSTRPWIVCRAGTSGARRSSSSLSASY